MKTRLRLIALLAVITLVVSACADSRLAATVDGTAITIDEVDELLPGEEGAADATTFRAALQDAIVSKVVLAAATEEYGIDPTEEEVETQYQTFVDQITTGAGQGDYQAGLDAQGLTDARVRRAAREQIVATKLEEELAGEVPAVTDEEIAAERETNGDSYIQACISHILLETEAEATETKTRLDAGEDFAAVATEVSIEPAAAESGGSLGCTPLTQWDPDFVAGVKAAEVGVVTQPVQTQFGWHLILVEEIDDDSAVNEKIRSQLEATATSNVFVEWVTEVLTAAEVEVEERFGTWVTEPQPGIQAPASETTTGVPETTGG